MAKKRTLNLRLLRAGKTVEDAFGGTFASGKPRALSERPWSGVDGARAFVGQIYSNPPSWRDFIAQGSGEIPESLFTSGAGAVVFIPVDSRIVAVCFGHVHIALNDDSFERQFGLKVTLNAVPKNQLRTLDLATPDATTFQKRIQASRDSDLHEFGVDRLRDLARVAGGTPRDITFATFVAGKDSLSITTEVSPETVHQKCAEALVNYEMTTYKTEFPWVDNLRIVIERDVTEQLDLQITVAIEALKAGQIGDLHLSPPEIVDYTEGDELHYNGFGSHGTTFHSLSISDYIAELVRCGFTGSIVDIKEKHRVNAKKSGGEEFSERWRLYDCFVFETTLGTGDSIQHYVLFAGTWYVVERKFKESVEAHFNSIPKVNIIGPTDCRNEQQLIDNLVGNRADLKMLDKVKINPNGVRYANLEPCDFFSRAKQFIHLKDGSSSGPISHLWSQGVVGAEAFVSDAIFRKKLRAKVRSLGGGFEELLPKSGESVSRGEYTVVYGIMRKPYADGSLGLPFFSKVSLQAASERIATFGIPMAIELIQKPADDGVAGDEE